MAQVSRRRAEPPLVLAIDIGSSSSRATLFDARARAVSGVQARNEHQLHTASDGAAIEHAAHLSRNVAAVIDDALSQAGNLAGAIGAVGMDTFAGNFLGVDARGKAVTPIYTYADTRPAHEVEELRRTVDVDSAYDRTGCPLHTAYLPPRVLWLRRAAPEVAGQVACWLDAGAYLYRLWTGCDSAPESYAMASWSGMLDRRALRWDEELCGRLGLDTGALPPLADYAPGLRGLSKRFARRWPALRDVPFFLAVGDGVTANIGSGCVGASRVALTVGTTGATRILVPSSSFQVPRGLWAYRADAHHTLLGGSLTEGGSVARWLVESMRLPSLKQTERELARRAPDAHGLTVLPFLGGERSPGWAPRATGVIAGLRLGATPLDVFQASLESISYRFGLIHGLLAPHMDGDASVIASGGAISGSPYWLQLMADVLERPVTVCAEEEATSRGAAALALHALGVWKSLDSEPAALGKTYEPDASRSEIYRGAMRRQAELYDAVIPSRNAPAKE